MRFSIPICAIGLTSLGLMAALPAQAHHSFAMFDRDRTASVTGTVKEFDPVNPHGWLMLMVADAQGKSTEWSLEMGGAGQLSRMGLDAQVLKPGDKVTVSLHPLKDGSNGGQFVSVTLPGGRTVGGR